MAKIHIVTDSTSDIPNEIAASLGIGIVPIYIRFGDHVYKDGQDITNAEFYMQLVSSPVQPATSQPTPEDFAGYYSQYCNKSEAIISIHLSSKISGTYNSANIAKKMMGGSHCPIEVIDSTFNSAGTMLVVLEAARMAKAGNSYKDILQKTRQSILQIQMLGIFSTMKYLARSGRVNTTVAKAASILRVMPLLTFHQGEIARAGLVRSFNKGMDKLVSFVEKQHDIQEVIITHSAIPEKAQELADRIAKSVPPEKIIITQLGAALGVHGGPGVLLVALRTGKD
jgi:DegV family protein with EDD domain